MDEYKEYIERREFETSISTFLWTSFGLLPPLSPFYTAVWLHLTISQSNTWNLSDVYNDSTRYECERIAKERMERPLYRKIIQNFDKPIYPYQPTGNIHVDRMLKEERDFLISLSNWKLGISCFPYVGLFIRQRSPWVLFAGYGLFITQFTKYMEIN